MVIRKLKIPMKVRVFRRRTLPAAAPGTVTSDEEDSSVILRQIYFNEEEIVEREVDSVDELMDHNNQEGVLWIDVVGVGNGEVIEALGKRFDLHPLALEDVVHTHQRSKCDDYGDRIYFVVRMLRNEESFSSEQVSLFLGPNFVMSIQEREGDCFEPIRERIRQHARVRHRKSDYLFYALIDAIIDGYFPRLEEYGLRLEDLEEQIFKKDVRLEEVYNIRSDLVRIRKHVWQHREAIQTLNKQDHELISEDTQVFIRDCYDHTIQLIDVAESFRDQCTNLRELHLSEMSARQNEVMKTLTIFATIFMPMSFIAGVYGMNFDHHASEWNMPETEWYYGYPFALGIMSVIGFGLLYYFWRKGWLKN
ncbi:MAG: magnesium/cobalt transporter CorA [Planctomicrobium sp.]|jgi:magnesium transporter|nr:magnesium/cobalt transporter CorA [Planctomicrobium sp.]